MADDPPLLKQYRAVKADHPDAILMFRIGDFFEMLEGDAELAARELELTLTSKSLGKAGRLPLCGVPHHTVETYIARLVRRGYHVAVCDQMEAAKDAKGLVRREVTRIVTPGTYVGGDTAANTYIACVFSQEITSAHPERVEVERVEGAGFDRLRTSGESKNGPGHSALMERPLALAVCDLLTGELYAGIFSGSDALEAALARFHPAEIVIPDGLGAERVAWLASTLPGVFATKQQDWLFGASYADDFLRKHFHVATLAGFGLSSSGEDTAAVAGLLTYLRSTSKSAIEHISGVVRIDATDVLTLDASTLLQLEIIDSPMRDTQATLRAVLDETVTGMGARLLVRRLTAPLKSALAIRDRLDQVTVFVEDAALRSDVRAALKSVHDLERLAGRISLGTLSPREAVGLAASLESAGRLRSLCAHPAVAALASALDPMPEVTGLIRSQLVDDPPIEIGASPLFRDGVSPRLDELRHGSKASREWIAGLAARERERTGIGSLKVGFNNIFGYFIEVTKSNLEKVPEDYKRKQTTAGGERYITEDLARHEDVVLRANERQIEQEREMFAALRDELRRFLAPLQETAAAVARLDVAAGFAEAAVRRGYARPEIIESQTPIFRVTAGRHPVVEALRSGEEAFVPNDISLDVERRFLLITGPNMAGKSTYIRQAALIALMAQCGSYVPAAACTLAPFDGIHARIGASDRLARGLSTFMVEMVEAALILRNATSHSLVILDELGRGTSTYDGLSLAWAIVEALAGRGCAALFATHYHELTRLGREIPGVANATVAVKEWGDRIHFLHEIRPGAADRSYGVQVAAIAGVPATVLTRAREILSKLELGELTAGDEDAEQLSLFAPSPTLSPSETAVLDAVRRADPDSLSPRAALDLVARLKETLK